MVTVLLVDDDPLMHRMLVPRLMAMPSDPPVERVVSATTPADAMEALAKLPPGPLAVLSDFNLKAVTNGLQLLQRVRDERPDALRVLLSGYSREQLGDLASGGDVHGFLEKPLILDELIGPFATLIDEHWARVATS